MRIEKVAPPPAPTPPREIRLSFTPSEGWVVLTALREYVGRHPDAADIRDWKTWVGELDKALHS